MKRMLAGAATVFAALAVSAGSAAADPNPFGGLGCSCDAATDASSSRAGVQDQVDQGIRSGLGSLRLTHGS